MQALPCVRGKSLLVAGGGGRTDVAVGQARWRRAVADVGGRRGGGKGGACLMHSLCPPFSACLRGVQATQEQADNNDAMSLQIMAQDLPSVKAKL